MGPLVTERPPLCVVLYTHMRHEARLGYAARTLKALHTHLRYSGPIHYHIADDNSDNGLLTGLYAAAQEVGLEPTLSRAYGKGYGGSWNEATRSLHTDYAYFLCIEDDWKLQELLVADRYVEDLAASANDELDEHIGCIRLGYLGWATGEFYGKLINLNGNIYFRFDPALSTEHHIFSGHPRFETRAWQRRLGLWPLNLDAGATEWEVSGRPESRVGVAWPIGVEPHRLFAHIGTIQAREDQHA